MNKKHWITVMLGGDVPTPEVQQLVAASYQLVLASLPKAVRGTIPKVAGGLPP